MTDENDRFYKPKKRLEVRDSHEDLNSALRNLSVHDRYDQKNKVHRSKIFLNPQAPVAQKFADELVFDIYKVKESSF